MEYLKSILNSWDGGKAMPLMFILTNLTNLTTLANYLTLIPNYTIPHLLISLAPPTSMDLRSFRTHRMACRDLQRDSRAGVMNFGILSATWQNVKIKKYA